MCRKLRGLSVFVLAACMAACGTDQGENDAAGNVLQQAEASEQALAVPSDAVWTRIDDIDLPETQHPYSEMARRRWTVNVPECADYVRVKFARLETEADDDFVLIRDSEDRIVQRFTGAHTSVYSRAVAGHQMTIQLWSDDDNAVDYGFKVAAVEAVFGDLDCEPVTPCGPGMVNIAPAPGTCECPAEPECEPAADFWAALEIVGGPSAAVKGHQVLGFGYQLRSIEVQTNRAPVVTWIGTADAERFAALLRHLLESGYFEESDTASSSYPYAVFTAKWKGQRRAIRWPAGDEFPANSELHQAISMFRSLSACGDEAGQCECNDGYSCHEGECVQYTCANVDCLPSHRCEMIEGEPTCVPTAPECGGFAGIDCPGAGECVDDPTDDCDPTCGGADCIGFCECNAIATCLEGHVWDDSPDVCACVEDDNNAPDCVCPLIYDPVCGVDHETYGNACLARCAGVEVDHEGECGDEGDVCGGVNDYECLEGLRCRYDSSRYEPSCEDEEGVCVAETYCDAPADCRGLPHAACVGWWSCQAHDCTWNCREG